VEYAKQMADSIKYLSRNIKPVSTASSVLVSSSKYLNHPLIRDVVATWMLRRNGPDWPVEADHAMGLFGAIVSLQDDDHIESLFVAERKKNPRFDAWMEERYISKLNEEDFKKFPPGSCGAIMNRQIVEFGFKIQLGLAPDLLVHSNNYTYYKSRTPQIHDYEHIVTGGSFDSIGEIIPYFARQANLARHVSPELAAELNVHGVLGALRLVSRAGLHYHDIWPLVLDCVARGIRVGQQSEPYFMAKFEDVLHLPPVEARAALGIRGAEDIDSAAASRIFREDADEQAIAAE
jgi:ubiquinone biosynthesis protein Coq4